MHYLSFSTKIKQNQITCYFSYSVFPNHVFRGREITCFDVPTERCNLKISRETTMPPYACAICYKKLSRLPSFNLKLRIIQTDNNDLTSVSPPEDIVNEVTSLALSVKEKDYQIAVPGIVPQGDSTKKLKISTTVWKCTVKFTL